MSQASRANARHYRWGDASDVWHLLEGEELSVTSVPRNHGDREDVRA